MTELRTPRLVLRQWRDTDLAPFAALDADSEVMRYLAAPLTREQSDALAARERARIAERDWGLWAAEVVRDETFIGYVGLAEALFDAHLPAVEVGWRLAREHWGGAATRPRPLAPSSPSPSSSWAWLRSSPSRPRATTARGE